MGIYNLIVMKGAIMSTILIKHKVSDYSTWKNAFDNFADFRKSSGEKSFRILHQESDPNDLTLLFEWDSQQNAESFLTSEKLKSTMQEAGVTEAPNIQFLNEVAEGSL